MRSGACACAQATNWARPSGSLEKTARSLGGNVQATRSCLATSTPMAASMVASEARSVRGCLAHALSCGSGVWRRTPVRALARPNDGTDPALTRSRGPRSLRSGPVARPKRAGRGGSRPGPAPPASWGRNRPAFTIQGPFGMTGNEVRMRSRTNRRFGSSCPARILWLSDRRRAPGEARRDRPRSTIRPADQQYRSRDRRRSR